MCSQMHLMYFDLINAFITSILPDGSLALLNCPLWCLRLKKKKKSRFYVW